MKRKTILDRIEEVEAKIGYTFEKKHLLVQAFTRRSYAEEEMAAHNEELEFFGDTVLGYVVVKELAYRYGRESSGMMKGYRFALDEGEMTETKAALVRKESLAEAMESLQIAEYLIVGAGDEKNEIWKEMSVREDLFEAILGAVAIDCGWDMAVLEPLVKRMLGLDDKLEYGIDRNGEEDLRYVEEAFEEVYGGVAVPQYEIEEDGDCPGFYQCTLWLEYKMEDYEACGYGRTEEGAKLMAAKMARKKIEQLRRRKETVMEAIGDLDRSRAVNQLQELWQKGIIDEPQYEIESLERSNRTGNDLWSCYCFVGEIETDECIEGSKGKAKNAAAYDMLLLLVGRDPMVERAKRKLDEKKNSKNSEQK